MIPTHKTRVDKHTGSTAVLLILTTGMMFSLLVPAYATPRKCTREDARKAETEASSLKRWHDVFSSYKRFRQCDDAAIGEGYSSSVATLLASQWKHFEELSALSRKYPRFKAFVLRHVDEMMTSEQDKTIEENVRFHCPADSSHLCNLIEERLKQIGGSVPNPVEKNKRVFS